MVSNYPLENRGEMSPPRLSTYADVVDKTSPKNPRLVYDLKGKVLMVQRIYLCRHKEKPHRYLSGSETILRSIPGLYSHACFPILMLYRSACSKNLVDRLETRRELSENL